MRDGRPAMMLVLAMMGIVLVISAGEAFPQQRPGIRPFVTPPEGCSVSDPVETENLYSFTRTEIQALSLARAGERASFRTLAAGQEAAIQQMSKTMTGLRQERIGHTCAGFVLSPFTNSKNETAATVAKYLVFAYEQLGKMTDEMLGLTMQESVRTYDRASTRLKLSDLNRRRQEILRNMTDALNLSLSMLLDHNHPDPEGKPDRLILTHEQKMSLEDYLHTQFPSLLDRKSAENSDEFIKQAALIQSFLAGTIATTPNYNSGTVTTTPK